MLLISHAAEVDPRLAHELRDKLLADYDGRIEVEVSGEDALGSWPRGQSWDDFLIVVYGDAALSQTFRDFVAREIFAKAFRRPVLPVSSTGRNVPPDPLGAFKSMPVDLDRISKRVGALLGMSLRTRDQKIFISYRASDGTEIATQVEQFLKGEGFNVWRDEAKDDDGQGSIAPGSDVQTVIEANLKDADLILLLDTPSAASSRWIKIEVDTANGALIPVLPILFRAAGEKVSVSRFRSLASLQRGYTIEGGYPVQDGSLQAMKDEMESFLCEVYRRKLRVPFLVETEFKGRGFSWSPRDHIIYEALRSQGRVLTRVYSHCSHFEGIFDPSLIAFAAHVKSVSPSSNFSLYVYDGPIISDEQIQDIQWQARLDGDSNVIILHNQEIAALLHNNFLSLAK